jgi:hypothetical protein
MEMIRKNIVLIAIIVVVVLGATLYGMSSQSAPSTGGTADGMLAAKPGDSDGGGDPDVLKMLLDMRSIKLDDRLFKSPAFQVLQDTGKDVLSEPKGRANPFSAPGSDETTDDQAAQQGGDQQGDTAIQQPAPAPQQPKTKGRIKVVPRPQE